MFVAIYTGPIWLNKASDQEKQAADQNQAFTTDLQNQYKQEFGNAQQIQGSLNQQLQNVMNQGMAGHGFLNGEESALRSDATERSAQQQIQAQQAANQQIAARSEGGALTSGAVAQGAERNAADAAANNAAAQRDITQQNAMLARQNVQQGMSGLGSLAGQEASLANGTGGNAVSNGAASFQQVTQAHQPSNFWGNLGSGLVGGVVNAFAPGVGTMLGNGLNRAINGNPQQAINTAASAPINVDPEEYDPGFGV